MKVVFISPVGFSDSTCYGSSEQEGAIEQQLYLIGKELVKMEHEVYIVRNWESKNEISVIEGINFVNVSLFNLSRKREKNLYHQD